MKACSKGSSKLMPLISPFRLNQNITGGEIVLLVREAIPANIIVSGKFLINRLFMLNLTLIWVGRGEGGGGGYFTPPVGFPVITQKR